MNVLQILGDVFVFYERIKIICKERETTVSALLRKIDLSTANTGKWKHGGFPSAEVLIKISKELDCSIDYLLGLTNNPEINK